MWSHYSVTGFKFITTLSPFSVLVSSCTRTQQTSPDFPLTTGPLTAHRSLSYLDPNERPSSMAFYLKFIFAMSQPCPMQDKHMKQWFWGKIQCWHDRLCHCKKLILHEDYLACASLLYLYGYEVKRQSASLSKNVKC